MSVPHETNSLTALVAMIVAENSRQNLVAKSTVDCIQSRHVEDSLQLIPLLPAGALIDIGSGGGFPGLVLASRRTDPVHLVEPRTLRADFLVRAARSLGFDHVTVHCCKVETLRLTPVAAITARAVASLDRVFAIAAHLADEKTIWVLPKGRTVKAELEAARQAWQGDFTLTASVTDPEAAIVAASGIRRRSHG